LGAQGEYEGKGQRVIETDQKLEAGGPGAGRRKAVLQVWKSVVKSLRDIQHKAIASNECRCPNNMVIFSQ